MDEAHVVVHTTLLLLYILFFNVVTEVQSQAPTQQHGDAVSNFEPSLAVVIGILLIMFSITFFLLIFARFCRRPRDREDSPGSTFTRSRRFSGIDKNLIASLPFFRFSTLKGSREGLECSVCLSKFEDVEILRLLPKCKHAFHIECIDNWLEHHSTCPLCRHRLGFDDLRVSNESNLDILIEREEKQDGIGIGHSSNNNHGSSRFGIGSSFRNIFFKGISNTTTNGNSKDEENNNLTKEIMFHKYNHRIVMSDVVFKNRWSDVSSSDIMFLNTEMLGAQSTDRVGNPNYTDDQILKIKEETSIANSKLSCSSDMVGSIGEKRCQSEITGYSRSRLAQLKMKELEGSDENEERKRQLWFPIARRTVQWFANRETISHNNINNSNHHHQLEEEDLDV